MKIKFVGLNRKILLAFVAIGITCLPVWAEPLKEIEEKLFFQNYSGEEDTLRLERIEKQIFGENFSGTFEERLARIKEALPEKEKSTQASLRSTVPAKPPSLYYAPQPEDTAAASAPSQNSQEILSAKSEEINRLLNEGVRFWKAKQGLQAIEKFEQVVRLDPDNAPAHFSLGIALEAKGNYAEAAQNYAQAQALDPQNKDYAEALRIIKEKLANKQEGLEQSNQSRSLAEDAARAYQSGEFLSALDLYKQLDEKVPNQASIKWNIGTIYLRLQNPYSALSYYKAAHKLKSEDEHYTQATKQLEESLKNDAQKQKTVDQAWDKAKNNQSKSKSNNTSNSSDLLRYYGLIAKNSKEGPRIINLARGSRAQQVGLHIEDVIKAVDGNVADSVDQINQMLLSKPRGQRFQFTIQRDKHIGQILF